MLFSQVYNTRADEKRSAADKLIGRLAKMKPEPRASRNRGQAMMSRRLSLLASLMMTAFAIMIMPIAAQNSALTPILLQKILNYIATAGADKNIPARIANPLGLSVTGQTLAIRQMATTDAATGLSHAFSVSRGSDLDVVVTLRNADSIRVFRAKRDGTLVTAVIYDLPTNQLTARNRADAQKELEAEFSYWANVLTDAK